MKPTPVVFWPAVIVRAAALATFLLPLALVLLLPAPAQAQTPPDDPLAAHVFPPELVMKHAQEIGLDEKQRAAIKDAIQAAQHRFLDAQWSIQEESQKLVRLLQARPVDERAVLAQADKVMSLESEVKRTHLSLLVRIKNLLSEAQQEKLRGFAASR
jgi:Spy/CpxP family protein refolding chaperone